MTTRGQDIVSVLRRQIEEFGAELSLVDVGTVVEVGDGIARIQGLQGAQYNEILEFPNKHNGVGPQPGRGYCGRGYHGRR